MIKIFDLLSPVARVPDVLEREDSVVRPSPEAITAHIDRLEEELLETENESVRSVLSQELAAFRQYRKEQDSRQDQPESAEYVPWKSGQGLQDIPKLSSPELEKEHPIFGEKVHADATQNFKDLDGSETFASY